VSVLVVEDDEVYREALVRVLARAGLQAVGVGGLAAAEREVARVLPRAAVVDLKLTDGSGIDVVRAVLARAPRCRVVMLTGHGTIPAAVEAMRAGAFDFLTKPVSSAELVRVLTAAAEAPATPLDTVERDHILDTLAGVEGNVSEAARRLGLHRRTLQRKLHKLGDRDR
jgi:two-component system response regulator RegA